MRCFSQEICPLERSAIRGAIACLWFSSRHVFENRPQTETVTNHFLFSPFLLLSWDMIVLLPDKHATVWKETFHWSPFTGMTAALRSPQGRRTWMGKRRAPSSAAPGEGAIPSLKPVSPLPQKARALNDASNSSLKSTFRYIYICRLSCSMSKTSAMPGLQTYLYIYIIV